MNIDLLKIIEVLIKYISIAIYWLFISTPIYWIGNIIKNIFSERIKNKRVLLISRNLEDIYMIVTILSFIFVLLLNYTFVHTGIPLEFDDELNRYTNVYTPLSYEHITTIIVFMVLAMVAYFVLKLTAGKVSPIIYVVCCSLLIINIIITIIYFVQTEKISIFTTVGEAGIRALKISLLAIDFMYIGELISSMKNFINKEKELNRKYSNKVLNKLYLVFINYHTMPIFWIVTLFPIFIIIQLILVLFGQQPDSFIKVFFDTSGYELSKVVAPDSIKIHHHGHYLCTVSLKGNKKLVKPLRLGIRYGNRIVVNRQLLIANAFENILEQYTPKIHRFIRYIYDKYGYPLSKHINTSFTADLTYILMKPLEWIFLIVLYCVDKNPENRISVQYSELRK